VTFRIDKLQTAVIEVADLQFVVTGGQLRIGAQFLPALSDSGL
jgi:hypothetical protein